MPTGNLPNSAKKLWEQIYSASKQGGDSEEVAARKAWSGVKSAGWVKDENGDWRKKSDVVEFSLTIKKASYDKATNEMRWRADTSDIDVDSYGDKMSMELFQDFLERIERNEAPAYPEFKSEFWSGGMPYLSVSHYPDLDGNAVPGPVDAVFIDGRFFRAKGRFNDTPLGKACWKAIKDDLEKKSEGRPPVRISIAFLDYKHRHLDSGVVFERQTGGDEPDLCLECLKARLKGENPQVEYLRGLLIHLAMTRVPVNKRTLMEVDKSMTTRKEDAVSIVGEELAEQIEEKAALVGRSEALVIKADDEPEEDTEKAEEAASEAPEPVEEPVVELAVVEKISNTPESIDPENAMMDVLLSISSKLDQLLSVRSMMKDDEKEEVGNEDDEEEKDEDADDEDENVEEAKKKSDVVTETPIDLVAALSEAFSPITQRLDMLIAAQSPHKADVPARRSISPASVPQVSRSISTPKADPQKGISIADYARKSVGLE